MTHRSVYRRHILGLLLNADGHALRSREVRQAVQRRMMNRFTPTDLELLRGKEPRWANAMQWERKQMVTAGLLEPKSVAGHGVWRATRDGLRAAQA